MNPQSIATGLSLIVATVFATLYFTKEHERTGKNNNTKTNPLQQNSETKEFTAITPEESLKGLQPINVQIHISDSLKDQLSEASLKTKVELTLRRNRIPLSTNKTTMLLLSIDAVIPAKGLRTWSIATSVLGTSLQTRDYGKIMAAAVIWNGGSFGTITETEFTETIDKQIQEEAEKFANEYLLANQNQ